MSARTFAKAGTWTFVIAISTLLFMLIGGATHLWRGMSVACACLVLFGLLAVGLLGGLVGLVGVLVDRWGSR